MLFRGLIRINIIIVSWLWQRPCQYQTEGETYETQLQQVPSHGSTALPVMGNQQLRTGLAANEDDHANRAGRGRAGQD